MAATGNALVAGVILGVLWYCWQLSRALTKSHPAVKSRTLGMDEELWKISDYADVEQEELRSIGRATGDYGVAVIGGSGLLGRALARLLLSRGHQHIRLIDVASPPDDLINAPACTFVRVDLRNAEAIRAALHEPFEGLGKPPSVVHCPAVALRFWERSKATRHLTHDINVNGIANVVAAMRSSPAPEPKILVFTSSVAVSVMVPRYMRLGFDRLPGSRGAKHNIAIHSDEDPELPEDLMGDAHYSRSKIAGEKIVLAANGQDGLRTVSLRAGMAVIGPTDRYLAIYAKAYSTPTFFSHYTQSTINARDLARAHIITADAMIDEKRYKDLAGDHFLVTGEPGVGGAFNFRAMRYMLELFSGRSLHFIPVPELMMFVLAHLLEAICAISGHLTGNWTPGWVGDAIYLQPSTFEPCIDVIVDDSRFRKLTGYRHCWTTPQSVRYIADEVNKELAAGKVLRRHDVAPGPLSAVAELKRD